VVCVPSAVDPAPYTHDCEQAWFTTEFGLPPTARVLGVIAQLIPRKGHRHLLAALPELLQRYPDLYVLCFGQGPLYNELAAIITAAQALPAGAFAEPSAAAGPRLEVVPGHQHPAGSSTCARHRVRRPRSR
jgi:glycosyltransferase involved in cell wall biosynthesis